MTHRLLFSIFISCFFFLGTTYFVSKSGNDVDGGGAADPWVTWGKAAGVLAAGDTVVIGPGEYLETEINPLNDGTSGNEIVWIDSTLFVHWTDNGINFAEIPTDTTLYHNAILDGSGGAGHAFRLRNDNFHQFYGLWFRDAAQTFDFDAGNDSKLHFCKSSAGSVFNTSSANDSLISCLVLNTSATVTALVGGSTAGPGMAVFNNTFRGDYTTNNWTLKGDGIWQIKNNFVENTSAVSSDIIATLTSGDASLIIDDWDFNIYYGPNLTNEWSFQGLNISTFSVWVDSVDNYFAGAEANSLNQDPKLKAVATTCYVDIGDAVTGENLGYGTKIGWYQPAVAAAGGTPATPKKGRPRFWGIFDSADEQAIFFSCLMYRRNL